MLVCWLVLDGQQRVQNEWHVSSDALLCNVAEKSEAKVTEFCHKQLDFTIRGFSLLGWSE
jgi:hypothetical protein